ncbi:MAG TPA: hypothetical protein VNH84_20100 [Candidatus Saccharimonadales bacterium]|nr:hypothetical protein [Candidatus Saccharimonadales bacterium]
MRRVLIHLGWAIAICVIACVVSAWYWQRHQSIVKDPTRIVAAIQAFSMEEKAGGRALPATVTLQELVRQGYLRAEETRPFDGMQVTISLSADESRPQAILMTARMADGTTQVLLGDGSAQGVSSRAADR